MDKELEFTMAEAWLLAMKGKNPSEAIINQERRGQATIVHNQRLPKKVNTHAVPNEIFFEGVSNNMSYEDRQKVTDFNLINYTAEQYKKMGIKIIEEYDDLFWNVELPEGWEIKATDHYMWNELRDSKGRKRATFFYKAAFYDRSAFINFETRFTLSVDHVVDSSEDYEVWRKSDLHGTIKDGEVILYQTGCLPAVEDYWEERKIQAQLWEELESFMKDHWPNYKNIHAYWD